MSIQVCWVRLAQIQPPSQAARMGWHVPVPGSSAPGQVRARETWNYYLHCHKVAHNVQKSVHWLGRRLASSSLGERPRLQLGRGGKMGQGWVGGTLFAAPVTANQLR